MAGLTEKGFEIPTPDEVVADIVTELKALHPNADTAADSVLGQLITITGSKIHEAWEQLENIYQNTFPDTAEGVPLGYIAAITGTTRRAATKSTVLATLTLEDNTTVPVGSAASVDGDPNMRYVTKTSVSNSSGSTGTFDVTMEAVEAGSAYFVNAGTLTVIEDVVVGWTAVTNAEDSTPGLDLETDAQLRDRREQELAFAGSCTLDAIRADVLSLDSIQTCLVFENPTGFVDALGLPAYSIEVLVSLLDSLDLTQQTLLKADLAQRIFDSKPAGINTYGGQSGTALDSSGNSHTVYFSEPTSVNVYISLTLTESPTGYTSDQAVIDALVAWGQTLSPGESVYGSEIVCLVQELDGVEYVDLDLIGVGFAPNPTNPNLILTLRQQADIDSSRITVTSI